MKALLRGSIGRFALAGFLSTALHVLVANVAILGFGARPELANAVAYVIATAFSYLMQTLWSFRATLSPRTLGRFLCVTALGLGVTVLLAAAAERAGFNYWVGIAWVVLCVPPITYVCHRTWTYRSTTSPV